MPIARRPWGRGREGETLSLIAMTQYIYTYIYVCVCVCNVCTQAANCLCAHERVILVFISRVKNGKNKHQNSTWVGACIILFLTWHKGSMNDDKATIFTHWPRVLLAWFAFCWWRHNWLLITSQWPDNCDAITRIMISYSLDIDLIHGDIHGWPCKKLLRWSGL